MGGSWSCMGGGVDVGSLTISPHNWNDCKRGPKQNGKGWKRLYSPTLALVSKQDASSCSDCSNWCVRTRLRKLPSPTKIVSRALGKNFWQPCFLASVSDSRFLIQGKRKRPNKN